MAKDVERSALPEIERLPTMKVKSKDHGGREVIINAKDFDPSIHSEVKSEKISTKSDDKKEEGTTGAHKPK